MNTADRLKRKRALILVLCIAAAAVIFIAVKAVRGRNGNSAAVKSGVAYLQSLEARDPDEISQSVVAARKEARAEAIASGKISLWGLFDTSLLFGDSRVDAFSAYEFLSEDRVMAHNGWTIRNLEEQIDEIVSQNPEYLFLGVGSNDIQSNLGGSAEGYAAEYEKVLKEIQEKLPDTKICVNSILPANEKALAETEYQMLKNVPEYNEALQAMCEKSGYTFIDLTDLCEEHPDLYEPDGVHFQKDFYELWGQELANAMDL